MSNHSYGQRTYILRLFFLILCWLGPSGSALADNTTVDDGNQAIRYTPSSAWFSNLGCPTSTCLNPGGAAVTWHEAIAISSDPDNIPPPPSNTGSDSTASNSVAPAPTPANQLQAAGASPGDTAPPPQQKVTPPAPPSQSAPGTKPLAGGSATQAAAPAQTSAKHHDDDGDKGDDGDDGGDKSGGSKSGSSGSSGSNSGSTPGGSGSSSGSSGSGKREFLGRRADGDDQIRLSYNFTGSGIYMYGVLPPASQNTPSTPTNMDVTITLDNQPQPPFKAAPVSGSTSYQPNVQVYGSSDLQDGPHQLVVTVNPNSTFIFDYIVLISNVTTSSTNPASTTLAQNPPSATDDSKTKKHNVATFAGALGGSVGVLGLFSLGLAISIIRRRRRAALRDRRDHESLHTNSSDDSPGMSGPAPFVPRFFPGTVIPTEPPTYNAAVASNRVENPILLRLAGSAYEDRHLSYADIPPESPPPPEDEPMVMPPPPPFSFPEESAAASSTRQSRPRSLAAAERHPASTADTEGSSQLEDSVGTEHSNSATAPELEPLLQPLQSHNSDRRPESRTSTRSILSLPPLPLSRNASRVRVNVDPEDTS